MPSSAYISTMQYPFPLSKLTIRTRFYSLVGDIVVRWKNFVKESTNKSFTSSIKKTHTNKPKSSIIGPFSLSDYDLHVTQGKGQRNAFCCQRDLTLQSCRRVCWLPISWIFISNYSVLFPPKRKVNPFYRIIDQYINQEIIYSLRSKLYDHY